MRWDKVLVSQRSIGGLEDSIIDDTITPVGEMTRRHQSHLSGQPSLLSASSRWYEYIGLAVLLYKHLGVRNLEKNL